MKVISFDVGIKNMAYCVIEYFDNCNYKILYWDTFNILESTNFKCQGKKKNNKICNLKALYFGKVNKNKTQYYCGTHKSTHDIIYNKYIDVLESNKSIILDNIKCDYKTSKGNFCNRKAKIKFYNKNYCENHHKIKENKILDQYSLKSIKKENSNKVKTSELAEKMYKGLDKLFFIKDIDLVLIENQPTTINPTMKTISVLLMGYFVSLNLKENKNMKIEFISPSNKLKVNEKKEIFIEKTKCLKSNIAEGANKKYKMTKKMGIEYTKLLLDDNKWLDYLLTHTKKDDLCDSFLQGYYYYNIKLKK